MLIYLGLALYLAIVLSLLWGRFAFFKMNSGTPFWLALSYDLAVGVQMISTVYGFIVVTDVTKLPLYICLVLYAFSLVLFWWSIVTAKSLDFAFSTSVGKIVTTGPFGVFRHPFYVSYILAWLGSSLLFGWPWLWLSLAYLTGFYVMSAKREEAIILQSEQSEQYKLYQQQVGMFLPRILKWKQSNLKH